MTGTNNMHGAGGGSQMASLEAEAVSPLGTERQLEIEATAAAILKAPKMLEAMEAARQLLQGLPSASSQAAQQTLEQMISESGGYAALPAASKDLDNPGLVWIQAPPKEWMGQFLGGSRFCFDNPDNIYRYAFIDDNSTYVLDATPTGPTGRLSVAIYIALTGAEVESWERWEQTIDAADEERIGANSEGASRVTIGPKDPEDGSLHLQSKGGTLVIVREALHDWHTQRPRTMSFRKVAGPQNRALTFEDRVAIAARYMMFEAHTVATFETMLPPSSVNSFAPTMKRGHATKPSMIKLGRFQLEDDEALIVNVLSQAAEYTSFSLTSPWLISRNTVTRTGSQTGRQSHRNADGTYTYVLSRRDPGVANWMDTGGLLDGGMAMRWEGMDAPEADPNDAIKSIARVKLDAIRSELPDDFPSVSSAERAAEIEGRRKDYEARCGVPCKFLED